MIFITLMGFQSQPRVFAASAYQEEPVYIVQQGDTLSVIARRFNIPIEDLQNANNISDPNSLDIGQRLVIPGLEGIRGLLTTETIPFGVTLSALARQYETSPGNLVTLNRLTSPSEAIAGISFIIPIQEDQPPLMPLYKFTKGMTGLEAAILSDTSSWILMRNNQVKDFSSLLPGEILYGKTESVDSTLASAYLNEISINALPVIQGETLEIHIVSNSTGKFSGQFKGEELAFFTENNVDYFSFSGVHALEEPGIYPLKIRASYPDDMNQSFDQLVLLVSGDYGNQRLTVDEDYLNQEEIEAEDEYIKPILTQKSAERYWDGPFKYPVDEPCLGSGFGLRRDYNSGAFFYYHTGLDFPVCTAQNLNIYATAAGEVVLSEEIFVYGNAIIIDHGWGVYSVYGHLSQSNVEVGDFVQAGDLIGIMGNTGRSAGVHLHFEIEINGTPVNPLTWLEKEFP
jgi:murein DD-endopeptidase MepM/ murein hydrolase activator NlpD